MPKSKQIHKVGSKMEDILKDRGISIRVLEQGEIVEGTVVSINSSEILVDVGAKSEGIISLQELGEELKRISVGSKLISKVIQTEDRQGYIVLSVKRADKERKWKDLEDSYKNGTVLDAIIVEYNKGGFVCECSGMRGFVPLSHLDRVHFANDVAKVASGSDAELKETLKVLSGKPIKVKVIELDQEKNRLVLSEKEALGTYTEAAKEEKLKDIKVNDVLEGVVTGIMPFGVFVDLEGVEGLVHISEIAWEKVTHPSSYFTVGQTIKVLVLGVDDDTKKLALSVKRTVPNPWEGVEERYPVNTVVKGKVSKIVPFGAFVNLEKGLDGLIHISETEGPLSVGDEVEAIVTNVEGANQKLALSIKKLSEK